jgi:hypothetical protein
LVLRARSGRRLHPHILVLAADEASLGLDHRVGEPLDAADDVQVWAEGVVWWLMELLDTGVLRWGRRVSFDSGIQAIDPSLEPGPPSPWYASDVSLQRRRERGNVGFGGWPVGEGAQPFRHPRRPHRLGARPSTRRPPAPPRFDMQPGRAGAPWCGV